jgi:hypothetical protein
MMGIRKRMYFLIDEYGEYLGKYASIEEAKEALDHLVAGEISAQDEVAIVKLDRKGRRVGEPIRHGAGQPLSA